MVAKSHYLDGMQRIVLVENSAQIVLYSKTLSTSTKDEFSSPKNGKFSTFHPSFYLRDDTVRNAYILVLSRSFLAILYLL